MTEDRNMGTVMIVDDSSFARESLKKFARSAGCEVIAEATDGIEAIEMWQELEQKPDVITMDITMPGMDGITCLKKLREMDPEVVVVMISALGEHKLVAESIREGAKNFVVKPFKDEEKIVNMFRQYM